MNNQLYQAIREHVRQVEQVANSPAGRLVTALDLEIVALLKERDDLVQALREGGR